ncbi:MAG TPA: peptide chain release factor N(5)-glutamine methyltransferase [Sulfuricaulis sp.]|nr:peptide chain release factor N(5)-glutamine methyltransferase [Sulfuricaulis sp.]
MMHAAREADTVSIGATLANMTRALQSESRTPRLDAEALVMHVTGRGRNDFIARPHISLTADERHGLENLLARRQRGEPVAYLTGVREFWSLNLNVSPATLIPRPETELLVEQALRRIPLDAEWNIADLGTGCGAIALALSKERPRCRLTASDLSRPALDVARSNARKFGMSRIEFLEGDWFAPLARRKFDLIVSNPPYVAAGDPHLSQGDLRFEPAPALVGGPDGLTAIRHIAERASSHLNAGGWLIVEHGWDQAKAVNGILTGHGYYNIACRHDLSGIDRITECRK